jgi:hypothetical protein
MKKIRFLSTLVITAVLLFVFFSCSFTESENVETSGIWVSYTIRHESDSSIAVWAVFRVGGPFGTILQMSSGEYVTCNDVMLNQGILNCYINFDTPAPDNTYTFAFHRTDETITTIVTTPASPDDVSTNPADNYNEWDPLDVIWNSADSESGDLIELDISGTNIHSYSRSGITDNGSYTVNDPKGTGINSIDNGILSPISVVVKRYHIGSVNEEYQGGQTRGERWAESVTINNFQPKLTLGMTISPENSGSITAAGDISGTTTSGDYRKYEMNEQVILTPVPASGWQFDHWSGDIEGTDNPYTIPVITGNMSIIAHFTAAL